MQCRVLAHRTDWVADMVCCKINLGDILQLSIDFNLIVFVIENKKSRPQPRQKGKLFLQCANVSVCIKLTMLYLPAIKSQYHIATMWTLLPFQMSKSMGQRKVNMSILSYKCTIINFK